MPEKLILDATCGMRGIWFQKNEPHTVYLDQRSERFESDYGSITAHRTITVEPDVVANFESLPFADNTFYLVAFDPPHILGEDNSWLKKMYGCYLTKEDALKSVSQGIRECMRVLKPNGVLIFKWNEVSISTREIINACGIEPLFGHRSGKKSLTHWLCFMKFDGSDSDS